MIAQLGCRLLRGRTARLDYFALSLLLLCAIPARGAEFLLSFFCQPPRLTHASFQEIKDAHFNVAMFDGGSFAGNKSALDLCQQVGIKGLVMDSRLYSLQYHPGNPHFPAYMDSVINDYKSHPALWGYYIGDEPSASCFEILGGVFDYLAAKSPDHIAYINLLPIYASPEQFGKATYEQHVNQFIHQVKPKLFSFDHYPLGNPGEKSDYFQNLELIRAEALAADIPFASVILATPHDGYRDPNESEIHWQINTALAYGAKGIFYYTYGLYDSGYRNGIVDANGNKTAKYFIAQRVNAGVMKLAPTLMKLKSTAVYHADPLPSGTVGLPLTAEVIGIQGGQLVIGEFVSDAGDRYIMLVNRDIRQSATLTLTFRGRREIFEVSRVTGAESPVTVTQDVNTLWQSSFAAGEGKLLRMSCARKGESQ